jgi:hypothetical protein
LEFPGAYEVGSFLWVNNERVVGEVLNLAAGPQQRHYGELFGANFDGSEARVIFGYQSGRMQTGSHVPQDTPDTAWGHIIDGLPNDDDRILIAATPFSGGRSVARLVDAYTGVEERTAKVSKYRIATFYTDRMGEIRFVTSIDEDGTFGAESLPSADSGWLEIPETVIGALFRPVAITDDLKSVYVLDNPGSDMVGLHRLSLDGASYMDVYTHERVDVTDASMSTDGKSVYAVRVDDGYPTYVLFSDAHAEAAVFGTLLRAFPGSVVDITSRSLDGRYWVVKTSSDVDAGLSARGADLIRVLRWHGGGRLLNASEAGRRGNRAARCSTARRAARSRLLALRFDGSDSCDERLFGVADQLPGIHRLRPSIP